jgi:CheY-like chemotaxis protein
MNAGPGRPSGGGGRNRRRRGRRPNNQRGQRPGPGGRTRENADGIYTAPMDHSYRAAMAGGNNGHKAGRQRPGFATQYPQPEPEPLPMREDGNSRIFAFVDDLFFSAKIQETARKLNVKVEFVKSDKDLGERMKQNEENPSLIIFDLNNASVKPLTLIPKLKSKLKKGTSIIGFLSHVQGDLKQKAHEVGCDMVLPRSAFSQNLPQLLRRHGAHEDENPTVQ